MSNNTELFARLVNDRVKELVNFQIFELKTSTLWDEEKNNEENVITAELETAHIKVGQLSDAKFLEKEFIFSRATNKITEIHLPDGTIIWSKLTPKDINDQLDGFIGDREDVLPRDEIHAYAYEIIRGAEQNGFRPEKPNLSAEFIRVAIDLRKEAVNAIKVPVCGTVYDKNENNEANVATAFEQKSNIHITLEALLDKNTIFEDSNNSLEIIKIRLPGGDIIWSKESIDEIIKRRDKYRNREIGITSDTYYKQAKEIVNKAQEFSQHNI